MVHYPSILRVAGLVLLAVLVAACGPGLEEPIAEPATGTPLPAATAVPTATAVPPSPTPTPRPPTPTPAPAPSAMDIMEASADAMQEISSYHFDMAMSMTVADPGGEVVEVPFVATGDVQAPDRMQMDTTVTAEGQTVMMSMIMIGDDIYVTDPTSGAWISTTQSVAAFDPGQFTDVEPTDIEGLALVGEETLDGTPAYHLDGEMVLPMNLGEPLGEVESTFHTAYWIAREDHRMLQATLGGDITFPGETGVSMAMSMTMRFADFDVPVTIEAPEVVAPIPADERSADAIFADAVEVLDQAQSYHFEINVDHTSSDPGQGIQREVQQTVAGDYQAPGKAGGTFKVRVQADPPEAEVLTIAGNDYGGRADLEFAVMGDAEYIRDPASQAWEINRAPAVVIPPDFMPYDDETLTVVGRETLGGVPVIHLHGEGSYTEESEGTTTETAYADEYWIGQADNRLWQAVHNETVEQTGQIERTAITSSTMVISAYDAAVSLELPPAAAAGPRAAKNGNLRAGPGTTYDIAGTVAAGAALEPLARNAAGDWLYVRTAQGQEAWIAAFLVEGASVDGLPVREAPAAQEPTLEELLAPGSWNDIPIIPGSLDVGLSPEGYYQYFTVASMDQVLAFYERAMAALGWAEVHRETEEGRSVRVYNVAGTEVVVGAVETEIKPDEGELEPLAGTLVVLALID